MHVAAAWKDKTALVTGASAGIGASLARLLAQGGARLVLTARRQERLEALKAELVAVHGVEVEVVPEDLGDPEGPGRLFAAVEALGHPVDLLINNAGFGVSGRFAETDWARERAMIGLNVTSLVELTKLFLPGMLARRRGDVLLVSSIAAFVETPTFAVYAATKAFVTHFGSALSWELRGTGVRVSVLHPGGTATEFLDVAGMKPMRLADLGIMSADRVARIGLAAMARGRRWVVTGWMNTVAMWVVTHLLPLGLRLRAAAVFQKVAGAPRARRR